MTDALKHRGPDEQQVVDLNFAQLGHTRLAIIDLQDGKQPMQRHFGSETYTIVYNGELYNTAEVKAELEQYGYHFETKSDTEVLLYSYIHWGAQCLQKVKGIFAFAIVEKHTKKLFLARDPFGVKPLFYAMHQGLFLFASEMKALFASDVVKPVVNEEGLARLLAIGPARPLGKTVYQSVFEVKPAHYVEVCAEAVVERPYYVPVYKEHSDSLLETIDQVNYLVTKAVQEQMVSDVPICTFLSGGIDSSIISMVASKELKKNGGQLATYSVEYASEHKFFEANDFQVSMDRPFVEAMVKAIDSEHHFLIYGEEELFQRLTSVLQAKDYPSMADIDSALYLVVKDVAKSFKVALSGECADELFGGYPWFQKEEQGLPWIQSIHERSKLLKRSLSERVNLSSILQKTTEDCLEPVKHAPKHQQFLYLNQMNFMQTLLERKDRMTMAHGLEVRVPFADIELVNYVWNIPPEWKRMNGVEKGLLRYAFEKELPNEIVWRKKNPFPKTHNPYYTKLVQQELAIRFAKKDTVLKELFDEEAFTELIQSGGESFKKPWFGQLMTGPQLLAYFIQLDEWVNRYGVNLHLEK